ncbi:major Facilitator Superfamily (MFS) [Thraustotheca clavata]|uniref:Major Facilitator Superfamily (MFS) n=1 Tax=Thraustotheca clavata TaxID=74557 RepID=A0A1W0A5I9_9STRA|nr:major Facilitator Superfamily (MFS) [Thraustotheca clavata]
MKHVCKHPLGSSVHILMLDWIAQFLRVIEPPKSPAQIEAEQWLIYFKIRGSTYRYIPFQRWMLFAAAFVSQICCGSIYSWSVINGIVGEYLFDDKASGLASLPFYIAYGTLGLTAAFFGPFIESNGPRTSMWLGAVFTVLGCIITFFSLLLKSLIGLCVGYGLFCGMGAGINYIVPIAPLQKWYPDLRGTAAGFAVCGFGLSGVVWGGTFQILVKSVGLSNMFLLLGPIFGIDFFLCGTVLRTPPPNYLVHGKDMHGVKHSLASTCESAGEDRRIAMIDPSPARKQSERTNFCTVNEDNTTIMLEDIQIVNYVKAHDYMEDELEADAKVYHTKIKQLSLSQCLRSWEFRFLYLTYLSAFTFGILFVPQFVDVYTLVFKQSSQEGVFLGIGFCVFNSIGRILCPYLSDVCIRVLGWNPAFARKMIFVVTITAQAALLPWLQILVAQPTNPRVFEIVLWVVGFLVGGSSGAVPSLCTDLFGVFNTGSVFGVLLTCGSLIGLGGGAIMSASLNTWKAQNLSAVYAGNIRWIHVVTALGLIFVTLVRTNPVDRFYPTGYQYSFRGRPIILCKSKSQNK